MNDWQLKLVGLQSSLCSVDGNDGQLLSDSPLAFIHAPIAKVLPTDTILIFSPDVTVIHAYTKMCELGVEFSLIQKSSETLLGVLSRYELEALLEKSTSKSGVLAVSAVMGRNICIEPDSASVLEVMDRMTMGSCPCTIIVSEKGEPCTIVSPRTLVSLLSEFVPQEIEAEKVA